MYGHGSFSIVSHEQPVLGCFIWMPNSGHEAKLMYKEVGFYQEELEYMVMDSKADSQKLFRSLRQNYGMQLVSVSRKHMDKIESRKKMIAAMQRRRCRKYLKERGQRVEPMQGLVKDLFDLECF